jgi:hypothetical protein
MTTSYKVPLTSGLSASKVAVTDANKVLISGTNTDAQLAAAVTASHAAVTIGGDPLSLSGQQVSFNYNTTNLKITSNQLNTIQDITTSSNVQFAEVGVGASPVKPLCVSGASTGDVSIYLDNTNTAGYAVFRLGNPRVSVQTTMNIQYNGSTFTDASPVLHSQGMLSTGGNATNGFLFLAQATSSPIVFATGSYPGTERFRIADTGLITAGGTIRSNTGFNLNGVDGVTGTFVDKNSNTVHVTGGIITSLT